MGGLPNGFFEFHIPCGISSGFSFGLLFNPLWKNQPEKHMPFDFFPYLLLSRRAGMGHHFVVFRFFGFYDRIIHNKLSREVAGKGVARTIALRQSGIAGHFQIRGVFLGIGWYFRLICSHIADWHIVLHIPNNVIYA
jgi:hypothetical protein